jgi:hypothetical protein
MERGNASWGRRDAQGTLISRHRDMREVLMTSIVLKRGVTLLDIVSSRMLGQFGFLATVFDIFRANQISVDVVATSEISLSLTLDPRWAPFFKTFYFLFILFGLCISLPVITAPLRSLGLEKSCSRSCQTSFFNRFLFSRRTNADSQGGFSADSNQHVPAEKRPYKGRSRPHLSECAGSKKTLVLWHRSKFWDRDLIDEELESLKRSLAHVATVTVHRGFSIISLICNVERTSQILERVRAPPALPTL